MSSTISAKDRFFSWIIVEIGWLSVLWIFWLTSGSYAAWTDDQLILILPSESSCSFGVFSADGVSRGCHEIKAVTAFSFLLWILLLGYTIMLIVLSLRAQQNGHPPWKTSVRDGTLFYVSEKSMGNSVQVMATPPSIPQSYPQSYPPAPQQSFPPSISRGIEV